MTEISTQPPAEAPAAGPSTSAPPPATNGDAQQANGDVEMADGHADQGVQLPPGASEVLYVNNLNEKIKLDSTSPSRPPEPLVRLD